MSRPPERIYLQIDPQDPKADFEGVDFGDWSEVSWHHERIGDSDVEYYLAPREKQKKRWKEAKQ